MLNRVTIMGRLTKEPELRHTQSDIPVVSFTLAVDRGFLKGEERQADFINIVAWRGTAEFVSKWFSKGQLVAVSGRIQSRTYKDRDGNNRAAVEVVADECFFAENKREKTEGANDTGAESLPPSEGEFEEIYGDDGELPF